MDESLVGFALGLRPEADAFGAAIEHACLHPPSLLDVAQALVAAWSGCRFIVWRVAAENPTGELARRVVHGIELTGLDLRLLSQWNEPLLGQHPIVLNFTSCLQDGYFGDLLDQRLLSDVVQATGIVLQERAAFLLFHRGVCRTCGHHLTMRDRCVH